MTEKRANFLVSAVRYNKDRTRIEVVERREDLGDSVGPPKEVARSMLIDDLEFGRSYRPVREGEGGQWEPGPPLRVVVRGGEKVVRIDARQSEDDDLGKLPEF